MASTSLSAQDPARTPARTPAGPAGETGGTAPRRSRYDRLYSGDGAIDFIGRSKLWYIITGVLLAVALAAMLFRGFNLGIDFEGGTKMSMPAGDLVTEQVEQTFTDATGVTPELTQIVGAGDSRTLEINSQHLSQEQIDAARQAIYDAYRPVDREGNATANAIGDSTVSESWGATITKRMILAMAVFFIAAAAYVALRLERDMAAAAMGALLVDGILILGTYSLFGLEVTPAMVIGLLTVLTFSIYDTVIVFDKVKENTAGVLDSRRATYAEEANLAVNQTVMRSISTSVISALPIVALLVVAVWMMGVGTLRDLALIQLIGVIEGVFSSLSLATPLLVTLVNRRKKYREHNRAVEAYRSGEVAGGPDELDDVDGDARPARRTVTVPEAPAGAVEGPAAPATSTWRPNNR